MPVGGGTRRYQPIGDRPLLLLGILLIFIGVQFVTLGLLAELQTRTPIPRCRHLWMSAMGKVLGLRPTSAVLLLSFHWWAVLASVCSLCDAPIARRQLR